MPQSRFIPRGPAPGTGKPPFCLPRTCPASRTKREQLVVKDAAFRRRLPGPTPAAQAPVGPRAGFKPGIAQPRSKKAPRGGPTQATGWRETVQRRRVGRSRVRCPLRAAPAAGRHHWGACPFRLAAPARAQHPLGARAATVRAGPPAEPAKSNGQGEGHTRPASAAPAHPLNNSAAAPAHAPPHRTESNSC